MTPQDAVSILPRKTFDCEVKSMDEDGSFSLYAAVFNNIDRQGDIIEPGAFSNLDEFSRDGTILLCHDMSSLPIGYPTEATQDSKGLFIGGKFHTTAAAQEARTVMRERRQAGKAVKCSIGYLTQDESFEKTGGQMVRHIKKLSVYEASIVNVPANPQAEVTDVKGVEVPELEAKRSVAISAANRDKMKSFTDAMDEHHAKMADCHKETTKCYKAMKATHDEMKSFLKGFDPAEEGEDEDDADEDDQEVVERRRKKPEKSESLDRESLTRRLLALRSV